jgi:diacylglycerol kinase (ATP)
LIAGLTIFFGSERIYDIKISTRGFSIDPTVVLVVGILVLTLTVMMSKLFTGRSNPGLWRGGVVSGHSAIGFFLAMTIIFTSNNLFIAILALLMAAIIAQSRVEAGVHSLQEVVLGAVIAIFLTSSVYWIMPHVRTRIWPRNGAPAASSALRAERCLRIAYQPNRA